MMICAGWLAIFIYRLKNGETQIAAALVLHKIGRPVSKHQHAHPVHADGSILVTWTRFNRTADHTIDLPDHRHTELLLMSTDQTIKTGMNIAGIEPVTVGTKWKVGPWN